MAKMIADVEATIVAAFTFNSYSFLPGKPVEVKEDDVEEVMKSGIVRPYTEPAREKEAKDAVR